MKQTLFTFMFIISLVLMTACGGSPVDKALAKLDDALTGIVKGLSGFMLQDDPDVKIFNAQTEMKEFSEREGKIYARLGRQVYETDGGENYPEIRAELDLLAANKQAAESRPRTCRGRGTCPPGSRGAGA